METARRILLGLLAIGFVLAGVNHFVNADFYVAIMPPYLPWHLPLVWLSGIAEVALGIAVLMPRTRSLAGWGLIALLVAVFPANLHMALNPGDFADVPRWALYLRLPLQLVLIAWAYWATRTPNVTPGSSALPR